MLDRLKFWKRKDPDFNFDPALNDPGFNDSQGFQKDLGGQDFSQEGFNFSQPGPQQFQKQEGFSMREIPQKSYQEHDAHYTTEKNLEVISSKLDAIKAGLEAINSRLANLERLAYDEKPKRRDNW